MRVRVGVDTGGTFTDFVRVGPGGLTVHKLRTNPADPAAPILRGLAEIAGDPRQVEVVHGSTVATNAMLERKGARIALVTTTGFEDVLAIGRQTRPELYNFFVTVPHPLVEPDLIFGVNERLDAEGAEVRAVDSSEIERLAIRIVEAGVEAVAVCFLHSYAASNHEAQVAERLREAGLVVSASHEILPEYREFERSSTTVANAYVTPLIDRYLSRLEATLGRAHLSVMQSNGGSISPRGARAQAVRTILSGPAAGVVGAQMTARAAGLMEIISFDMGGTSTDVSLVEGEVQTTTEAVVGGVPVRVPVIDIHTVGAGGGSIARLDSGGALVVGPESAGASPGPACYGTGDDLTVTDANLLLGRLDADYFLGGRMALDRERARIVAARLARRLRLTVEELSEGVVRVANASMQRAIRVVSLERGHDPRRFALVAFGGAGGMHAADIAADLSIGTVLVPRHAGVLSALGMLACDVTRDYSASVLERSAALSLAALNRRAGPLLSAATRELSAEGFRGARLAIVRQIDVRYVGQSYEIGVPWSIHFERAFHRSHRRRYGYADEQRPTEVVAIRVRAVGLTSKPRLTRGRLRAGTARASAVRPARFDGRVAPTAFYRWDDLAPGDRGRGPAVITGGEATLVVPPTFVFALDAFRNVTLGRRRVRS